MAVCKAPAREQIALLGWGRELADRGFQPLCRADEIREQLLAYIHAAFIGRQIPLVVRFEKNLEVGGADGQGVNERLKDRDAISDRKPSRRNVASANLCAASTARSN